MRFESRAFFVSKDLEYPDQYQDAFELNAEHGVAAIADGVSSAIFSGPWARLLTRMAVDAPPDPVSADVVRSWLAGPRTDWAQHVDSRKLAWYQRPKLADGAMTTLLWLTLSPIDDRSTNGDYRLRAFAVGDCCLFHVRDGAVVCSFPMTASGAFGLNPAVIGSIDRKADHLIRFETLDTQCRAGDLLVLCTDAVALWAISRQEAGQPVQWEKYWNMPDACWQDEIAALRSEGSIRYDDTTLVLLRVAGEHAAVEANQPAVTMQPSSPLFWWQHRRAIRELSLSSKLQRYC
jgi:hypothetical protein